MKMFGCCSCHCLSHGGTFRRMQAKRTPVLAVVRRNELPKNKMGLRGNGLDGKKIRCVERLRQLSILKVLVNHDRDVCMCMDVISGCLRVKINHSWVTQGNFPELFLSLPCLTAQRQERSC